jgi:hypothetical protein
VPGGCVAEYRRGERYLVLANRYREDLPLQSGDCTGTLHIKDAKDALEFMRDWAAGKRQSFLQGRIGENVDDEMVSYSLDYNHGNPLKNADVIATRQGKEFRGRTDERGQYRILVPEPGLYSVAVHLDGYAMTRGKYAVKVVPEACSEQDIGMWTDSRVKGSVRSTSGEPRSQIAVQLVRTLCDTCGRFELTEKTKADGSYEFRNVPPGQYLLGINVGGLQSTMPYPPRFYPGVDSAGKATPIHVEGARSISQLDFTIKDRLPTRRIDVQVVWPDGRPVVNAVIRCVSPEVPGQPGSRDHISRRVDSNGRVSYEVLADRSFTVDADALFWESSVRHVRSAEKRPVVSIPAGLNSVTVKIVVDAINDISSEEKPVSGANDPD